MSTLTTNGYLNDKQHSFSSVYLNYPAKKPFLNSEWTRQHEGVSSKAFPESNRDVIINALKNLQRKINNLEINNNNQVTALNLEDFDNHQKSFELNLEELNKSSNNPNNNFIPFESSSNNLYAAYPVNSQLFQSNDEEIITIDHNHNNNIKTSSIDINQNNEVALSNQLFNYIDNKSASTEKKVLELEKQLAKMRKILNEDASTSSAVAPSNLNYQADDWFNKQKTNTDKRSRSSKKLSKKKTADIKPTTVHNEFFKPSSSVVAMRSKSADVNHQTLACSQRFNASSNHYRLNLGDIPFVVGKSTTPSHHLPTNIQNVISLLKKHHPKICGSVHPNVHGSISNLEALTYSQNNLDKISNKKCPNLKKSLSLNKPTATNNLPSRSAMHRSCSVSNRNCKQDNIKQLKSFNLRHKDQHTASTTSTSSTNSSNSVNSNVTADQSKWDEILKRLQDDYTKLVLQHYDLTKKVINSNDNLKPNVKNEYEIHMEYLNKKMKVKAKQINKLKSYHQNLISKNNDNLSNENDESSTDYAAKSFKPNKTLHANSSHHYLQNNYHTSQFKRSYDTKNDYMNHLSTSNQHLAPTQQTHSKTLKLFKDIKNLQSRLQMTN